MCVRECVCIQVMLVSMCAKQRWWTQSRLHKYLIKTISLYLTYTHTQLEGRERLGKLMYSLALMIT